VLFYNKLNRLHKTKVDLIKEKINEITKVNIDEPYKIELGKSLIMINDNIRNLSNIYKCFSNKLKLENKENNKIEYFNNFDLKTIKVFKELN
jgi:hypothetical protein